MGRISIGLLGAVLLSAFSACGPAGVISGKVTVEGGNAGGIAVIIYGPESAATVTNMDGTFSVNKLPDGVYVVRATLRDADVEEVNVSTTVTNGTASPEPILAFRASTAKITGKVVMTDGSGAQDLTVTATGPEIRGTRTAADGSFTFDNLKTGAYVVSVEGPDTKEGRVAVGVNASGSGANTGDLRLTPVGRFGGTVVYNAMPVANAPVVVTGTNVTAVTDSMGRYSLVDVPAGNQAVLVRVGTAPFFRSATAMVTVARGLNPDVPITLTDDMPRTGTVTGTVTFHGPRTPRDITVNAPGSGVSATPQANGAYSLALPVGVWDVVANAPQHPVKFLGRVTVVEGTTQALPGAEVTWYRPVWTANAGLTNPTTVATGLNDNVPWSLVTFADSYARLALVNSTTYDFRILAAGTASSPRISKTGKYAGWFVSSGASATIFVYEIATATLTTIPLVNSPTQPQGISSIEFSSDESAVFAVRTGTLALTRVKFASITNPETFPPGGGAATQVTFQSVDRWFVRDSTNSVRLVTPSIDVAGVFTNVNTFSATPTAWAFTNCAINCDLYVLGPTSTSPALRDSAAAIPAGSHANFSAFGFDNRADYPCFSNGSTSTFCVNSMDASHITLAAHPQSFKLNEAGDRVIWAFPSGANSALREERMPPSSGTSNRASNTVGWTTAWISPTRSYGLENSGSPRQLHLFAAGTETIDSDVGSQVAPFAPPLLVFPQLSTSQWRAYLGDGAVRSIPVATNVPVSGVSVRPLGGGTSGLTRYAAVSFDTVNSYIVDESGGGRVNTTAAGTAAAPAYRSGATEYFQITRPAGGSAFYVFNSNSLLEYNQADVTRTTQIGAQGVQAWLGLDEDDRTILVGGFQP